MNRTTIPLGQVVGPKVILENIDGIVFWRYENEDASKNQVLIDLSNVGGGASLPTGTLLSNILDESEFEFKPQYKRNYVTREVKPGEASIFDFFRWEYGEDFWGESAFLSQVHTVATATISLRDIYDLIPTDVNLINSLTFSAHTPMGQWLSSGVTSVQVRPVTIGTFNTYQIFGTVEFDFGVGWNNIGYTITVGARQSEDGTSYHILPANIDSAFCGVRFELLSSDESNIIQINNITINHEGGTNVFVGDSTHTIQIPSTNGATANLSVDITEKVAIEDISYSVTYSIDVSNLVNGRSRTIFGTAIVTESSEWGEYSIFKRTFGTVTLFDDYIEISAGMADRDYMEHTLSEYFIGGLVDTVEVTMNKARIELLTRAGG